MLAYLQGKLALWGSVIGAVLLAILYAFTKGRKEGREIATTKITHDINTQAAKVEEKLTRVDNQPVDFNAAAERLRRRATSGTPK